MWIMNFYRSLRQKSTQNINNTFSNQRMDGRINVSSCLLFFLLDVRYFLESAYIQYVILRLRVLLFFGYRHTRCVYNNSVFLHTTYNIHKSFLNEGTTYRRARILVCMTKQCEKTNTSRGEAYTYFFISEKLKGTLST
jgi:hypothetical protein